MPKRLLIIIGMFFLLLVIGNDLLFKRDIDLKRADHTINILLLGIGGGTHDGPDLTDSIIFANINESKNKVVLISLPRDLWIEDVKEKINTVYALGESKKEGEGIPLTKSIVSKIVKQPISYVVVANFDSFVKAIDLVGGLDMNVERAFDDYRYPVEERREDLCRHSLEEATAQIATMSATEVFPCRYEYIHFDVGQQHMDGERALVFVRSRFASGVEGTDFARSRRQQKVIEAFREKVLSLGILLNPIKVINLYSVLSSGIETNIETTELDDFIRLASKMKKATIYSFVIDVEDKEENKKGLLTNPSLSDYNGSWVLVPRLGKENFSEIQAYVSCLLTFANCEIR